MAAEWCNPRKGLVRLHAVHGQILVLPRFLPAAVFPAFFIYVPVLSRCHSSVCRDAVLVVLLRGRDDAEYINNNGLCLLVAIKTQRR